ncbi:hypothetical protein BDY21DRAFT_11186 [Lineolata rhizophorae]|uniref:Uncharacterized protein n=1 Tax=Lineolata rhizophorae TaxID=578093 RepID=A0A6A6PE93_9PEZI|nr:hypothetical protein BDY21DRAFT_11186 [Lineolata rhizophorae]
MDFAQVVGSFCLYDTNLLTGIEAVDDRERLTIREISRDEVRADFWELAAKPPSVRVHQSAGPDSIHHQATLLNSVRVARRPLSKRLSAYITSIARRRKDASHSLRVSSHPHRRDSLFNSLSHPQSARRRGRAYSLRREAPRIGLGALPDRGVYRARLATLGRGEQSAPALTLGTRVRIRLGLFRALRRDWRVRPCT